MACGNGGVRFPDVSQSLPTGSFGVQVSSLFAEVDEVLARGRPRGSGLGYCAA
jgi:hypothetical protein